MLVASPRYLERAGLPRKPADLASHALILGQPGMRPDGWAFRSQRRSMSIRLEGKLNMTVNEVAIRAAVSGVGIASSSIWGCRNELQQGDLVRVLPEWETGTVVSTQWFPQVARRSRHQGLRRLHFGRDAFDRVTFQIRRGEMQTPNSADVRIYNVADSTAERIKNEFTQVVIQAGYQANFGLVFRGTIKQIRKGREDAKDTYVDITAADGDEAYNFSPIARSLAAGTTPQDDVQHTCHQTGQFGPILRERVYRISVKAKV
jgi:hypothetical protein